MAGSPRPEITAEYVRSILDYDPETGIFTWKPRTFVKKGSGKWNDVYAQKIAGSVFKTGYIVISFGTGRKKYAHRLAWLYMTGEWPKKHLDHIDTVKTNNQWSNLREANDQQNGANQKIRKNNTSGYKNVHFNKRDNCYESYINVNRKKIVIGYFKTADDAYKAYCEAAPSYHGEYVRTA